ncbi:MAG: hypothetical protein CMH30_01660 [Micavibrio sp.]|nr:hypothetical protein [Micavibrio sp.]|tara:strand:- start:605 stop:1066 length:462 start_codon:yes stop_codon:yes gene_type:complete
MSRVHLLKEISHPTPSFIDEWKDKWSSQHCVETQVRSAEHAASFLLAAAFAADKGKINNAFNGGYFEDVPFDAFLFSLKEMANAGMKLCLTRYLPLINKDNDAMTFIGRLMVKGQYFKTWTEETMALWEKVLSSHVLMDSKTCSASVTTLQPR